MFYCCLMTISDALITFLSDERRYTRVSVVFCSLPVLQMQLGRFSINSATQVKTRPRLIKLLFRSSDGDVVFTLKFLDYR